jgi:chromosomal replication initiator protein
MDYNQFWNNALSEIEVTVSQANFNTWFKDTHIVKEDSGLVCIGVPSAFAQEWLKTKFHNLILQSLRNVSDTVRSIEFVVSSRREQRPQKEEGKRAVQNNVNALPLQDVYINKEDNLNPRYVFDNFIVGPFNELAHAAAQAVVKKPGIAYNPLFIYGNTGYGKTHLIQAVGNHLKKLSSDFRVHYVTSERFALDYINSIQNNKTNSFKEKYRKYDVLIMDDIQFLSNKEKTQEELFHLFNTLYDNNKQIIFASDKHPNYIPNLEDRLKSRFAAGMIVDIPAPDHESRVAILKTKAQQQNSTLSDEAFNFLASMISSNIRELEGALNAVVCQSQLKGRDLSLNEIKYLVKNSSQPKKNISPQQVVKIVADFYNIEENSIYQKTRRKEVIRPRQMTMYILREDLSISYPSIGQKLGGRDHTTVIHSCEKIKNELKSNNALSQELEQLRALL